MHAFVRINKCQFLNFHFSLFTSLNPSEIVATTDLCALLGSDLDEFATKGSGNGHDFAPRSLNVAEGVAFLVRLTDKRFQTRLAGTLA